MISLDLMTDKVGYIIYGVTERGQTSQSISAGCAYSRGLAVLLRETTWP